ncbi:hypothetical protein [Microcoleus sp. PH2017_02_FOX_O_A]|nr:hypothetical protein [Microcoleus sp. PH2017_02_FOX_O_A]MCC3506306.1 hypothetical protein [Microcoleus sp. PH2017_19_SFW_U_A]MCC3525908.1 hypothetical protein [Microcoleus sp. PH2017_20_SFW_D_A]MCC3556945.1 hypothetical protein [Microcoleus sp. PH2017_35_SFW_U_B]
MSDDLRLMTEKLRIPALENMPFTLPNSIARADRKAESGKKFDRPSS